MNPFSHYFEVIRTIRSKKFSFEFAKDIYEFIVLRKTHGKVRSIL